MVTVSKPEKTVPYQLGEIGQKTSQSTKSPWFIRWNPNLIRVGSTETTDVIRGKSQRRRGLRTQSCLIGRSWAIFRRENDDRRVL